MNGARRIRVLVADDQPIDRKGLAVLLSSQSDMEIVGEAATTEEAIARWRALKPDVVTLALRMPDAENRGTAAAALRAACADVRILAIAERGVSRCLVLNPPRRAGQTLVEHDASCQAATDCLQLAVTEGALGAIRRSADPEDLFRAVRAVAAGSAWYELGTAARLLERAAGLGRDAASRRLTARELDVLGLISDGRSNKEIAQALDISEPTVKKHVGHILEKLGLQDRLQIGLHVARNPLLLVSRPSV